MCTLLWVNSKWYQNGGEMLLPCENMTATSNKPGAHHVTLITTDSLQRIYENRAESRTNGRQ